MSSKMRVLLTGAFGNVGAHVLEHLVAQGHEVTALDVHSGHNDKRQAGLAASRAFTTAWTDLGDAAAVSSLVTRVVPDAIVHLAAIIAPVAYAIPDKAYAVNIGGMRNLIAAARALGTPPRFVFTSSYSVHGPRNPYRHLPPLTGDSPLDPRDNYGCHKVLGERMVRDSGLPWVVVRLPAVWPTDADYGTDPAFLKFGFMLSADRNCHAIDSRDAALALANAAQRDVVGRMFDVGGGPGWSGKASGLYAGMYEGRGLHPMPDSAYRLADPDVDESWYYEDIVDTAASQAALDYQKHSVDDYCAAVRPRGPAGLVMPLLKGAIRKRMLAASPYFGTEQTPDRTEMWVRICETFGTDPGTRDCLDGEGG